MVDVNRARTKVFRVACIQHGKPEGNYRIVRAKGEWLYLCPLCEVAMRTWYEDVAPSRKLGKAIEDWMNGHASSRA